MQKIKRGNGFRGVLEYAFGRDKEHKETPGILVGGNMTGQYPQSLAAEFAATRNLRPDIKKPVWHNSLRLPTGERLSSAEWVVFADAYMRSMGFSDVHLRCYVLHDDGEGQHIHIIASRVALDNTVFLGKNENLESTRMISALEKTFGLTITKGPEYVDGKIKVPDRKAPGKAKIEKALRTGVQPPLLVLQQVLDRALTKRRTMNGFLAFLDAEGVIAIPNLARTGRMNGFSFYLDGPTNLKGSVLGALYSWNNLVKEIDYEQDRDIEILADAKRRAPSRIADRKRAGGLPTKTGARDGTTPPHDDPDSDKAVTPAVGDAPADGRVTDGNRATDSKSAEPLGLLGDESGSHPGNTPAGDRTDYRGDATGTDSGNSASGARSDTARPAGISESAQGESPAECATAGGTGEDGAATGPHRSPGSGTGDAEAMDRGSDERGRNAAADPDPEDMDAPPMTWSEMLESARRHQKIGQEKKSRRTSLPAKSGHEAEQPSARERQPHPQQPQSKTLRGFTVYADRQAEWAAWRERILTEAYNAELAARYKNRYYVYRNSDSSLTITNHRDITVTDYGDRLVAAEGNVNEIALMLAEAKAKGWKSLRFRGSQDFRERAATAALALGFGIADPVLAQWAQSRLAAETCIKQGGTLIQIPEPIAELFMKNQLWAGDRFLMNASGGRCVRDTDLPEIVQKMADWSVTAEIPESDICNINIWAWLESTVTSEIWEHFQQVIKGRPDGVSSDDASGARATPEPKGDEAAQAPLAEDDESENEEGNVPTM